ncbi:MAG: archaemetzincin [bacterium]|nr:archaemetzincin [bacterium]
MAQITPLHEKIKTPGPTDWLAKHEEPGQTFEEYLKCKPILPDKKRNIIYVSILGDISEDERELILKTVEFIEIYFNLPVKMAREITLEEIPETHRRKSPVDGTLQISTEYIMNEILKKELPKDASVYTAITKIGLWPGEDGWNFVHGMASLYERVAINTFNGYGKAKENGKINNNFFLRILKTSTHEIGHMFSIQHCIKYQCNMCGSNHINETDQKPLWLCPECMAKVCWLTRTIPKDRYKKLMGFCQKYGLTEEYQFYKKSFDTL